MSDATKTPKKLTFSRTVRGQITRATNRLNTVEAREFPSSSNPTKVYHAVVHVDGKVLCDCQGWTIKKQGKPRSCKHVLALIDGRDTRTDGEFLYITTTREAT